MNARGLLALALCTLLVACMASKQVGSDCESNDQCAGGSSNISASSNTTDTAAAFTRGGNVDKVDLLFVVDDSGSMSQEQLALASAQRRLLTALSTGDADGAGAPEFRPVTDLHLGVISTDMGLLDISDVMRCQGIGDDGVLLNRGCNGSGEVFTRMSAADQVDSIADEMSCMVQLGTDGCGFEQQLEAPLKALSSDGEVTFLDGTTGHGMDANAGFLRNDSLLIIVVITDEDDCSPVRSELFKPANYLDPTKSKDAALLNSALNTRCHDFPDDLRPVTRYINGLRALRSGAEDLVMFFAIAGYPVDRVAADTLDHYSFEKDDERDAFYDDILATPEMAERVDDNGTPDEVNDDTLFPVCETDQGMAYPGTRLLEVARGFGTNGLVQSICNPDMDQAVDAMMRSIARRVGPPSI